MSHLFLLISTLLTTVHPWVLQSTHTNIYLSQTDDVSLKCLSDESDRNSLTLDQVTRIRIQKKDETNSWNTYAEATSSDETKVKLTNGNADNVRAFAHVGFSNDTFLTITWSSLFEDIPGHYVCEVDVIVNGNNMYVDTKEITISDAVSNKYLVEILVKMSQELKSVKDEMKSLKNESVNRGISMSNELKSVKDEMKSLKNESVNRGISMSNEMKSVKDEMETSKGELTKNTNSLESIISNKSDTMSRDMKIIQDTITAINPCPAGWSYYSPLHTCIRVYNNELIWTDARKFCQIRNGDLVKINNEHMNNFVTGFVSAKYAWIGLNDSSEEEIFVWLDESEQAIYTNRKEVDTDEDDIVDCVLINTKGTWEERWCYVPWSFICQIFLP